MIARCGGLPGEQKVNPKDKSMPEQTKSECSRRNSDHSQQPNEKEEYAYAKHEEIHQLLIYNHPDHSPDKDAMCSQPRPTLGWGYSFKPASPPREEVTWQSEQPWPLDMRVNQSMVLVTNDEPTSSYQHPVLSPPDNEIILDLSPKSSIISDAFHSSNMEDAYSCKSPKSSRCSSVIQFASRKANIREEKHEQNTEEIVTNIRNDPVLPFTLEEEFKVIDFIVRIEDYLAKRFIFIDTYFGDGVFPEYRKFTMENAVCTNMSGMLPYNYVTEKRLFSLALEFTQMNFNQFYNEMKSLSNEEKINMLNTSFPSTYVIFYAILENNNAMQPLSLGCEKVRNIRMRDMERFTSPWALDYADEVKFNNTVQRVGEVLGSDMKLQALYHMLVMVTPHDRQVCNFL